MTDVLMDGRTMEPVLERVVTLLVEACDPEEILLFGSHAKGGASVESDLDLLVIGRFGAAAAAWQRELAQLLDRFPIRVDLLVATREQVERDRAAPHGFIASVLESAVRLHPKEARPA
jgi:predicted nucleotidyltransferase